MILTFILFLLKALGVIKVSWFIVFVPFLIVLAMFAIFIGFILFMNSKIKKEMKLSGNDIRMQERRNRMIYRKKPVEIEAIQFFDTPERLEEISRFGLDPVNVSYKGKPILKIQTLEGEITAQVGDYIIKGIHGEFYPCKPNIFEQTYEKVQKGDTP